MVRALMREQSGGNLTVPLFASFKYRRLTIQGRLGMIQRTEARRLSSRREWSLILGSLPPSLEAHSAARLKSKISRARKLRDKYQDLYRRQKIASKSRMTGTPYERLNLRTFRKKQMFGEAMARLRQQLARVSAPARKSTRVSRRKPK